MTHRLYQMPFSSVYPALYHKATRKGRTEAEVDVLTQWLTGYSKEAIHLSLSSDITYGDFFRQAPELHPQRDQITGKICGVEIAEIEDPLMQVIRQLDKLVDRLVRSNKSVADLVPPLKEDTNGNFRTHRRIG